MKVRLASAYGRDTAQHDNSLHGPSVLHVDSVAAADPDNHEPPDFEDIEISREEALATAHAVGCGLAEQRYAIANHHAERLQPLFHGESAPG